MGTAGNDTLNDGDTAKVVLGGAGDDVLATEATGANAFLRFDGGAGEDTLCLDGSGLSLDLTELPDARLASIEVIDLTGSGDNRLTLSRLDLLALSEVRADGKATLRVDGNAGDRVTANDEGWARGSDGTIAGTTYRVFENENARLLVAEGVEVRLPRSAIIRGDAARDQAGHSVSEAGDVNGDGYADVIVGAPMGDDGGRGAGEAYVVYGKVNGLVGTLDLMDLGEEDGFVIQGGEAGDGAGISVSGAGDVNGDGYADLIVGAQYADLDADTANVGRAYVVYGKASRLGRVDLADLAEADGFAIVGVGVLDRVGASVSGAGDVNGDGYADLIVGAPEVDGTGKDNVGEAYVIFARAEGMGEVNLSEGLGASEGFVIRGDKAEGQAG